MADPSAKFTIKLDDQTSGPAAAAARALEQLRSKIEADKRALRDMQAAMKALQSGTVVNVDAYRALQSRMQSTRNSIATAQADFVRLGGSFGAAAKAARPLADAGPSKGLAEIRGAAQALPGPLGSVVGKLTALGGATAGGLVAISLIGVAAGIAAVTTAAITGVAALLRYGIAQAEALRAARISKGLAAADAIGDARTFQALMAQRALSFDKQVERLHKNLANLFSGLRIEGFLSKIAELAKLFSQSTASGRALKVLVEALLQPMIDAFDYLAPIARRFFQGLVIAALELTIVVLRVRNWLRRTFGDSEIFGKIDALSLALEAGRIVFIGLAAAVVTSALAIGALVVGVGLLAAIVVGTALVMASPFILVGAAIYGLIRAGMAVYEWFVGVDWSALGSAIVDGIRNGITAGAEALLASVRGLASGAESTLRSALGIQSPSRVFAELGVQVSRGFATGVDAGAPDVGRAVVDLAGIPRVAADDIGASSAQGTTIHVSIGDVHVHTGGNESPRNMALAIRDELSSVLEGLALQMGAPA